MAPLYAHVEPLYADLGELPAQPGVYVDANIVTLYNQLLDMAKTQLPNDPILASLTPQQNVSHPRELYVLTGQLARAVAPPGR
jgi:hypothetical protein